jgi:GNAT superfamily N-acetyltransferase
MEPRLLTPEDVPQTILLSTIAGWNQTPEDWLNVISRAPEGCWGLEARGVLVATATGVRREDGLVWIGMVLTHPDYRGCGCATALMRHIMDTETARGALRFGLDATAMGQPIYERLGFRATSEVERWRRQARAIPGEGREKSHSIRIGNSWAETRPGRVSAFFGPAMADHAQDAEEMVKWFLASHAEEPCLWDLDPKHPFAPDLARAYDFEPARWLVRMYVGEPDPFNVRAVALPGFEYPPCV